MLLVFEKDNFHFLQHQSFQTHQNPGGMSQRGTVSETNIKYNISVTRLQLTSESNSEYLQIKSIFKILLLFGTSEMRKTENFPFIYINVL